MCIFFFLSILCEIYLIDFFGGRENDVIFKSNLDKLEKKNYCWIYGEKKENGGEVWWKILGWCVLEDNK